MRQQDSQFRIAVEHAAEIKAGRTDGGVERIADEIVQVIGLHPVGAGDIVRMNKDESAEFLRRRPHRLEARVVEVLTDDVGGKHRSAQI